MIYEKENDDFCVPKYGVIEHDEPRKVKKLWVKKWELREWLSGNPICFYFSESDRYIFSDAVMVRKPSVGRALILKHEDIVWALVARDGSRFVKVFAFKDKILFTDSETKKVKRFFNALLNDITADYLFWYACNHFPRRGLVASEAYIMNTPQKKKK